MNMKLIQDLTKMVMKAKYLNILIRFFFAMPQRQMKNTDLLPL